MRVFVALELPGEFLRALKNSLGPLREKHPRFRWVEEKNIHITLAFLGELDGHGLSLLEEAVRTAARTARAIPISAGRLITLPRGRPANVLALGLEGGREEIAVLASSLEEAIAATGKRDAYPFRKPETRPFTPHITLARRGDRPIDLSPEERELPFPARGTINTLRVFRSELFREGPRYTSLGVHVLGDR
ncbi:MAG: RNA 2',3'-cyclic phosphodiesterase [Treponema sp.]|jgi:2'-5' RNA ligase|nr:RNA 2',3'-cyclic phosphodiesterase [Treponema sp.]